MTHILRVYCKLYPVGVTNRRQRGIVPKASISATNARILHEFDKPCAKGTFVYSWHLNNRYGNC